MPRIINQPDRAAYGASKPLFDALTKACSELDKEADSLKEARDQIAQMHATHAAIQQTDEFKAFVLNVMDSWSYSLTTHHTIFKTIVELTNPDPIKDDDSPINVPVQALMSSIDTAITSTIKIRSKATFDPTFSDSEDSPKKPVNAEQLASKLAADAESSSSSENAAPKQAMHSASLLKGSPLKRRKLDQGDAVEFNASPGNSDDEPPEKIEKVFQSGKKRKSKPIKSSISEPHETDDMGPPPAPARKNSTEDISAEVQARMDAKAEKKRKKQEAKKRKRDSIASSIVSPGPVDFATKPDEIKAAQPPKKKTKVEEPKPKPSLSGAFGTGPGFGGGKGPVANGKGFSGYGNGPGFGTPAASKGLAGANAEKTMIDTPSKKDKRKHSGDGLLGGHGAGEKQHKKKKAKTAK